RVAEILPRLGEIYAFESAIGLFELAAPPDGKADPDAILAGRIFGILEGEESVGAQARADLARGLAEAFRRGEGGIDAKRKDGKPRPGEIDPAHIK
ncbi:MAG: hypothetical protein HYY43_02055, partial [Deltaproteobacteria bacterium]|nr:hypothetical protein [Deltaproteobacteria bacterium]